MSTLSASVYQNEYLPAGGSEVNAILSVSASPGRADLPEAVEIVMIDCSGSMGHPLAKLAAAMTATCSAIDRLRDGTRFAIVAGSTGARLVYPAPPADGIGRPPSFLARATPASRAEAKTAVRRLTPGGGTAISSWLELARQLFATAPGALHHAILLTDGKNESDLPDRMAEEIQRCAGCFQCDCRGIGTDWDRDELRSIADRLLGTVDIIPRAADMPAAFETMIERAMSRRIRSVVIAVQTPVRTVVRFFKQVSPELADLTALATWHQPEGRGGDWRGVDAVDPGRPLLSSYPTGAWTAGELREYHVCLSVLPQALGEANEVRVGRVGLLVDGREVFHTNIRAIWTDDPELSTRINPKVAHYEGQAELAESIELGLEAKRHGDLAGATERLGRAAQLAHRSRNEGATRLLRRVVDIEDAERGTVRLRDDSSMEDEMTLDTRSRRTVRMHRDGPV